MDRPFYPEKILELIPVLLPYLLVTFRIIAGTVLTGLFIGFFLAKGMLSRHSAQRKISFLIINAFRCTPSIVMLFIVFYGLPNLFWALFKADINGWAKSFFVILALGLLFSASAAEIIRSSYLSISKSQREAGLVCGLTEFQTFRRIIFPQAFAVSLPNLGNSLIALLKESSLAYTIGLVDVMGKGNLFISMNFGAYAVETYTALFIIYWALTISIEQIFGRLEKHFSRERKAV